MSKDSFLQELSAQSKKLRKDRKKDPSFTTPTISIENDPAYRKIRQEKEFLEKENFEIKQLKVELQKQKEILEKRIEEMDSSNKANLVKQSNFDSDQLKNLTEENNSLKSEINILRKKTLKKRPSNGNLDKAFRVMPKNFQAILDNYHKIAEHINEDIDSDKYYAHLYYSILKENIDENGEAVLSTRQLASLGFPSKEVKDARSYLQDNGFISISMVQVGSTWCQKVKILK